MSDGRVSESAKSERRRVEIVHESLLTNWPRLVGWQTQDADGTQGPLRNDRPHQVEL